MKPAKFFLIFIVILFFTVVSFGQNVTESDNWLKGFNTEADYLPTLLYWSGKFTKEDLDKGKKRLNLIRQFAPKDEWEGLYYGETGIGGKKFIWNSVGGFFYFYFYHELKSFYFGTAANFPGFVELNYEELPIPGINKSKSAKPKLVKVKLGEKHFLVPENRLQDFCNLAAGLNKQSDDFNYYWTKEEDIEKRVFGLPVFSSSYKRFLRNPLEAKIIGIGKKKVIPNEQSTKEYNFDDILYPVTINAGINKNLKIGMNFFVEDSGEWIEITNVLQNKSNGFIRRNFDENMQEQCRDSEGGSGQTIPCKKIKSG